MKKFVTIFLFLFFIPFSGNCQKTEMDHGSAYLQIKNMSYDEFKNSCGEFFGRRTLAGHLSERFGLYSYPASYALSTFPASLGYDMSMKMAEDIERLALEFSDNAGATGFSRCTREGYAYLQLHLEKYEIIAQYYQDVVDYGKARGNQKRALEDTTDKVAKNIAEKRKEALARIDNDAELINFMKEKAEAIRAVEKKYSDKIDILETRQDEKIKMLGIENYSDNKAMIIKEFRPQIMEIEKQKKKELASTTSSWNDKMENRKDELQEIAAMELARIENEKSTILNKERARIKDSNNLTLSREEIENNYKKDIDSINEKIKALAD